MGKKQQPMAQDEKHETETGKLTISNKLYGRNSELNQLIRLFNGVGKGEGLVLAIPGVSGAGKTSLIQTLKKPVKINNGFFISGKFEQYQKDIPYFAFRQALENFYHSLVAEDQIIRDKFVPLIQKAVGALGQVLTDLVPHFERLLGKQPNLAVVSPQEARHRFYALFHSLIKAISLPEHPLVLFIDDWQWADMASIELLKNLQKGTELRYLMFIVAYRQNEVDNLHPLTTTLNELQLNEVPFKKIEVLNLSYQNVYQFLKETLLPEAYRLEELSHIIYEKTKGNPFFVKSVLLYLSAQKMLWLSETNKRWEWTDEGEHKIQIPEDVVALFVQQLKNTPETTQRLLFYAACLGNRFDLEIFSIASKKTHQECQQFLSSQEVKEIIKPLSEEGKNPGFKKEEIATSYIFLHDKLQQAAFSLIAARNQPPLFHQIGQLMLTRLPEEQLNANIFEVANLLNAASGLTNGMDEQIKLIELNVKVARKAFAAAAYNTALQYLRKTRQLVGLFHLEKIMSDHHHRFFIGFLKDSAQCEFIEGYQEKGEEIIGEAINQSVNAIEKADFYKLLITQFTLQARYADAIHAGKVALQELDVILPEGEFNVARDKEIAGVLQLLTNKTVASLGDLPKMNDQKMLMICSLLITMGPPCYRAHQKLWSVIVPLVVKYTIQYGNIPQIGYSHTAFGGLVGWVNKDYLLAKAFSEVAERIMKEQFTSPADQSVYYLMVGSSVRHWFRHMKYGSDDYTDAYETGLRSGNLQYAAYAFGHNMYCRFFQGVNLETLMIETRQSLIFSKTRHNQWAIDLFNGGLSVFTALSDKTSPVDNHLFGNDGDYLDEVAAHQNIQVTCIYKIFKTFGHYLFNQYDEALTLTREIDPILYSVGTQGLLPWPEYVAIKLLVMTALYRQQVQKTQRAWLKDIQQINKLLKTWATSSPQNFKHKYLLASAETERLAGHPLVAVDLYSKASKDAHNNGFTQWEGIINERLFQFWTDENNSHLAYQYWKQSYFHFKQWGATAKTVAMEAAYKKFLHQSLTSTTSAWSDDHLAADAHGEQLIHQITDQQINQVREFVAHMEKSILGDKAMNEARELAEATARLRREITIRKNAEEDIILKNKELERLNAQKDKFFSILSHDLKSPFNAILGFSRMLYERAQNNDLEKVKKYADIISHSSEKYMDLLMNLFEWSNQQRGGIKFKPVHFNLSDLMMEIEMLYLEGAQKKHIRLLNQFPEQLKVYADQSMISTILRNLVSNALKFSHPGGEIVFTACSMADSVEVSIKDDGVGMAPEIAKNLFEIEDYHSTRGTENEAGTGLGLILCKEFVMKHGGKIWVESQEKRGSAFFFTLPQKTETIQLEAS
jgi:predicted ATPase/signal transduction histidine kinase